ncbi:flagellar hook protein FlgE [Halopseudomonas phragmitis]|uniref:Flagellar hook protein FlgE n=2 Tax=Pseudomonadaceae TaxID=135621 RepID=A0A1V0B5E8_9GAMM|nr:MULTISPECIES: flagellar hook protein FlgE [Pseudomonadaceae]AQZ95135.1 hypothetical protein BVH74_10425 [Halopseudomonas phragmitis]RHW21975.1 flagellar hook protein FlgE [Pseudomonas jilinensis]
MSFNIGLSGIRAASADLNVTGNNIANAGTIGFKQSRAEFADVYAASVLGTGRNPQGSGVLLSNVAQQFTQGNVNFTQNTLDLAINGNGFFVTSNNGAISYTRAGYFGTDREGNIINNFGERLQGYGVNPVTGQINQGVRTDLRIDTRAAEPNATTEIRSTLNLNSTNVRPALWQEAYDQAYAASIAGAADPDNPTAGEIAAAEAAGLAAAEVSFDPTDSTSYNSSTSVDVYDSLGNSHVLTKYFVKTDANTWEMIVLVDGRDPQTGVLASDPAYAPSAGARFDVNFNNAGQMTTAQPFNLSGWVPLDANGQPTGATSPVAQLAINLTGSTQYASTFGVNSVVQDGFTTGELAGLEIDDTGVIFARYTNGQTRVQGQLILATFANQQGLTPLGKTAWAQSFTSGEPVIGTPGSSTLGVVQSGALEASNVELSDQLVNLIVAQRNYQANAKTIQTEDAVTQTIINLR